MRPFKTSEFANQTIKNLDIFYKSMFQFNYIFVGQTMFCSKASKIGMNVLILFCHIPKVKNHLKRVSRASDDERKDRLAKVDP